MNSVKSIRLKRMVFSSFLFFLFIQILFAQTPGNRTRSQDNKKKENVIKLGFTGGIDFINPERVNDFIDYYINMQGTVVEKYGISKIKVGLGVTGYGSISLSERFEIRPSFYFFIAPKIISIVGGSDLNVLLSALAPGCTFFLNFPVQDNFYFRVGGGPFYYFQSATFDYDEFGNDKLTGKKLGFHFHIGGDYYLDSNIGLSGDIVYRTVNNTDNVKSDNRKINYELDYTGFEIQGGLFLILD